VKSFLWIIKFVTCNSNKVSKSVSAVNSASIHFYNGKVRTQSGKCVIFCEESGKYVISPWQLLKMGSRILCTVHFKTITQLRSTPLENCWLYHCISTVLAWYLVYTLQLLVLLLLLLSAGVQGVLWWSSASRWCWDEWTVRCRNSVDRTLAQCRWESETTLLTASLCRVLCRRAWHSYSLFCVICHTRFQVLF